MRCGVKSVSVGLSIAGVSHGNLVKTIRLHQIEREGTCQMTSNTPMDVIGQSDLSERKCDYLEQLAGDAKNC
jgi:hypothetical protein